MDRVSTGHVDFFVSYNHRDEAWATWIAWQLEQAEYTVSIQAWDFRPGNNFVLEMQQAAVDADRTIVVLSPSYIASNFTQPEWAAAFAADPRGHDARVIPVRVEPCNIEGLLGQIVYIDLVGKDVKAAAGTLLAGISPGRAKPVVPPAFPGAVEADADRAPGSAEPTTAAPASPDWRRLNRPAEVRWRGDLEDNRWASRSGPALMEAHLVPSDAGGRLEVRRLNGLSEELADLGRATGIFTVTQRLTVRSTAELALAQTVVERDIVDTGLVVTRDGQRGAWVTLPTDGLGSVFDPPQARMRLEAVVGALLRIEVPTSSRYGVAIGLSRTMMLTVGSSDLIGRRSSAAIRTEGQDIRVAADEDVSSNALRTSPTDIAEELVARLAARLN